MPKNTAKGGGWVTINGVHVFIEGGKITKGPAKFIGSSVNDLPSGKSAEDKKAELKAKYGAKTSSQAQATETKGTAKKAEESKKAERPTTMGDYWRQQSKLTGRTEPTKRGVSARKSVAKETPAEAKKDTKSSTPSTGNTNFDNAKSTTKSTAKNPTKANTKSNHIGEPGLQVAHYDSAKGGRNVYTAVYPDGSTKKLTASQAKEMFPNDPIAQRIKTRTSTRTASATPSAQANFNSAVQSAQNKGTGSKNEKAMQKKYGKAFDMGNW